jgi:hypothetical protein
VLGIIWHYTCHPTAVVPENVISADYPGAVRRSLRERFGQIPCVFAQGFCGNVRPSMVTTPRTIGWRERLGKIIRMIASGPTFATPSSEDWVRWSQSLASNVCDIARRNPVRTASPASLQSGSAAVPLSAFFEGSAPNKNLTTQAVRIGEVFEIVALSAEANVEWERILDEAIPAQSGRIRLYVGYLGALFGYLPTAKQVPEGGYEVEGFQRLFGLSGRFKSGQIGPAVTGCVKSAFEDLDRAKQPMTEPASPAQ